jgi:putative flavoprotein involved in K+ transport
MVPQRPLGRDLFWWLTTVGLAARPADSGPARHPRVRELVIGRMWRRLRASGDVLRARAVARSRAVTVSESHAGFVIGTSWRRLSASGISLRPRATTASGSTLGFADGSTLDVAAVVWATGFRLEYLWLDVPGVVVDGRVLHTEGVSVVPGLSFLGLPWLRSRSSAWLGFVAEDAAWLAERLRCCDGHVPVALPGMSNPVGGTNAMITAGKRPH